MNGPHPIGEGHHDVLKLCALIAEHIAQNWECLLGNSVAFAPVGSLRSGVGFLRQFAGAKAFKTCGVDGGRHGKGLKAAQFVGSVVAAWLGSSYQRFRRVINAVGQVQRKTLTRQCVSAAAVDSASLRIHHVVVLEKAFAASEVVLFDLLLGALNALGHHGVLDHVALFMPHAVHQACNALRAK